MLNACHWASPPTAGIAVGLPRQFRDKDILDVLPLPWRLGCVEYGFASYHCKILMTVDYSMTIYVHFITLHYITLHYITLHYSEYTIYVQIKVSKIYAASEMIEFLDPNRNHINLMESKPWKTYHQILNLEFSHCLTYKKLRNISR